MIGTARTPPAVPTLAESQLKLVQECGRLNEKNLIKYPPAARQYMDFFGPGHLLDHLEQPVLEQVVEVIGFDLEAGGTAAVLTSLRADH